MIQPQRTNKLGIFLSSLVLSTTLCSATVAPAVLFAEQRSTDPLPVPSQARHELFLVQHVVDKQLTRRVAAVTSTQQQGNVRLTPINWQARPQQEGEEDQPVSPPPSDLPAPPDPEPEPYANVPGPTMPQADAPMQPGLPPPPMPKPAAPHLAPSPPPMPEPAQPPPLSQRPDLNPAHPGMSKPSPVPPSSQTEPTVSEPTTAKIF